jgi:acyl-coenzyme A synthetase/AMP-(fatty) acid ligase
MKINLARYAVAVIVIGAIAAAVFRVSTAPDRVRQRLETARAVCVSSGGEWVTVERDPICVKGSTALAR